jgi:hypothetical protein
MVHPLSAESGHYPLMELRDVVFGRNEYTAVPIRP